MKRILVAGIGNIFLGDDAFGCEVTRELAQRRLPAEVRVIDFGIRSYDLAWALTEQWDAIILVDAAPRGEIPGTVYLLEPELGQLEEANRAVPDAHAMNPASVLQLAQSLGGVAAAKLLLVGCEPAVLESEGGAIGLSQQVRRAVPKALEMIESLIGKLLSSETKTNSGLAPA